MEPLFRPPAKQSIFALYRSYLRQVRLLPHEYLRQFFRLKSHDDVLSALDHSRRIKQRSSTYRRLRKDCARLERANNADKKAFEYILDLAYGRKGPLKWSIMKPLLSDPTAPAPDRIISAVEYSRPPVYSPELAALLVSDLARPAGRTLKQHHLDKPPTLPPRADPSSAEARLFGPLSKRREVNLRWRFFADQWKRLYPPLEVSVRSRGARQSSSQEDAISDARIRPVGMQTAELLDELQALAGPVSQRSPHPRKLDPVYQPQAKPAISDGRRLPTRYLRRRYRELLGRIPILTYSQRPDNPARRSKGGTTTGKYEVSLAHSALTEHVRSEIVHSPEADGVDLVWVGPLNASR